MPFRASSLVPLQAGFRSQARLPHSPTYLAAIPKSYFCIRSKHAASASPKADLQKDDLASIRERLERLEDVPAVPVSKSATVEAAVTALLGLVVVFMTGIGYVAWYKRRVLDKIEIAFSPGYDPALELANRSIGPWAGAHMRRQEQELVDQIVDGTQVGHYYLILGPKGTGKGSMIIEAMRRVNADGVAVCDAHPDLEVLRVRLGKALNFDYNEDSQFGLFQRRDPKDGGPALDIERALNKLEKVALRCAARRSKPFVLIFNNVHLLHNDDEGRRILRLLQQKAEVWSESGIVTMVFCTDDFWPYTALRKAANRMQVLSIYDLSPPESLRTLRYMRDQARTPEEPDDRLKDALRHIGGRLSVLNRLARTQDVVLGAKDAVAREKAWLLSQIGLIPDCDDDVMDEQKWSSCSWLLLQEFVKQHKAREEELEDDAERDTLPLPSIPYWKCRQIMSRGDFLEGLDHANVISIDINHDVRPDSVLILRAAREVCEEEGFDDALSNVLDRIDEIESLHRTNELTLKSGKGAGWWHGWFSRDR